jgi:cytochrome P450
MSITQPSLPLPVANGPKGLDFVRTMIDFYSNPIRLFDQLHHEFGDIVRMQGGPYCVHLITQPSHIKHILLDNHKNYSLSGNFDETVPVLGKGLTTNSGPTWLRQRRMVQSAFHRQHVMAYAEVISTTADAALAAWMAAAQSQKPLQIDEAVFQINRRILGKLLFSVDFNNDDPFLAAFDVVRKVSIDRVRSMVTLPPGKKYKKAIATLDAFTYRQIRERRADGASTKTDILSLLMTAYDEETGESMTDTELHDELMTLFFAAYEDVANAVGWAWYLLDRNPEMQSQLYAEIDGVLGDRLPAATNIAQLPYLTMVVNETLRLYPPTWSLLRDVINDDIVGGYHIPAGSTVLFNVYLTHRLPEFWDNPEAFDPERFLPERSAGRPRYAYLPFGGGPRQCIGNELALMEIKLIIARMAQMYRFKLASAAPLRIEALTSLRARDGVWMRMQARSA